jgi:hypothetical protein
MADADKKDSPENSGPKKERSPSFPYIGLSKALERARQLYAHARRHEARLTDVATAWGLGAKSSATLQTAAALLAYGLLEDQGSGDSRKLKITDLAFKALEDQRPGARETALAEAAIKPKLIAEYAEKWKEGRPADGVCESELRIDRGFTEDGAKQFLRVYDDTITYTKTDASDKTTDKSPEGVDPQGKVDMQTPEVSSNNPGSHQKPPPSGFETPPKAEQREEKFALTEGDVVIRFPECLSVDSVSDLEAYLKIFLRKAQREAGIKKSEN